jgi:hypothetical protein
MNDVFKSKTLKLLVLPLLKFIESKTFNYATHINLISGGFEEYFNKFNKSQFSYFSNGIDEEFLQNDAVEGNSEVARSKKLVVYAGNIGEGQGLHKDIPQVAKRLTNDFQFMIIGDGGAKKILLFEMERLGVTNVVLENPINRSELQKVYNSADYLFLHLNDYPAFRKVLPSKIFELATFNKPILAGVSGFSAQFIKDEISHSFVFEPCNVEALLNYLVNSKEVGDIKREEFINRFTRKRINKEMSESILSYI